MESSPPYGSPRAPKATLTLRVRRDLRQRLHELAFSQNRSLANLSETVLKQYVERVDRAGRHGWSDPELLPCEIDDNK